MNKKSAIMLIIGIIVTVPIIVGSTYAYYLSTTKSNNSALNTNASNFEVIYTGGEEITGPINLSKSREQGLNTSVKIKMAEGSALAKANIYINVEKITSNISIDGFIWEVVGIKNGVEVYNNKGFSNPYYYAVINYSYIPCVHPKYDYDPNCTYYVEGLKEYELDPESPNLYWNKQVQNSPESLGQRHLIFRDGTGTP